VPAIPIDGHTQLVGLIGWPVEHSMSPAMQNAAFEVLGLNWRYVPLPVPPGQVGPAVRGLVALGFRGANVTVPHKEDALRVLEDPHLAFPLSVEGSRSHAVAPDAEALGAVNTIVVERGWKGSEEGEAALSGHNTDVAGFVGALRDDGFRPQGTSAVVVGAGGAARAVVFGLIEAGAEAVTVLNRTVARAEALVSDLRPSLVALEALPLSEETLIESARSAGLLVNATPVGMWPHVDDSIWPETVPMPPHLTVFDLVYNPLETRLQRQARACDANAIDGLGMLVRQGALALEMWTGREAPLRAMRAACERWLQGGAVG
jgi:shikimate dehydrogenase